MSQRDRTEGNTDAPKVDENEVRAENSGKTAPRRVKEVRTERGAESPRSASSEALAGLASCWVGWPPWGPASSSAG